MRILDLARKDLSQILRDWKSGLFLLVMPIVFTLFFGFVFTAPAGNSAAKDTRLQVGLLDQDGGVLASSLETLLEASQVIRPVLLTDQDPAQANQMVQDGKFAAVVSIPSGYTDRLLAGQPALLNVIADQSQPAGQTAVRALETVTGRLLGSVEAAHISLAAAESKAPLAGEAARQSILRESVSIAVSSWQRPPLIVEVTKGTGQAPAGQKASTPGGFGQASSGMMVQFAVFGLITSAMVLVLERKSRTLQRLLTSPITRVEVIAGHVLAMFLVVLMQQLILVLLGQFAFGVNYFRQPLAILLMVITLSLWAASLGLLISAVSRKEDQVITLSLIAMFIFAALGGAWFPLEVAGKAFATVGHIMPTAWAMDGFQNILARGLDLSSVLMPAGVLLAYAAAFFALAVWRFRFE